MEVSAAEVVLGMELEEEMAEEVEEVVDEGTVKSRKDCDELTKDVTCITFLRQLLVLAHTRIVSCCFPECLSVPAVTESFIGSAVYLTWVSNDAEG